MIQYALMVNPTIYVSCIKQFWTSVLIKKSNDVVRLQALIDRKKVIITKDTIRQALRLDDAAGVDCLPNEEIFAELASMGYEKPSTKLTFYKAFFSTQWKFLIHTILYMVRNVDSPSKFLMYLRFLQLMIIAQVDDLSSHNTKYTSPALIRKVFANMRRIGKGFSGVDTPLFDGNEVSAEDEDDDNEVSAEPTPPLPTPRRLVESQAKVYHLDLQHAKIVLSMQDTYEAEPAEVEGVIKVVTTVKLMTKVVTTAAQVPKASVPRRRRGVVIQDTEETATTSVIMHTKDETFARQLEAELNANINWDDVMDQRINKEEEELKAHLQIVVNDDDDVFTEATPLASKVPVVDYQIHHENNKPYYKIIIADGTHKLFISFITLLKNSDKEDLEMLWKLLQKRFQSSKPKNFLDDFLLNTFKIMFEKPNVEASI
nr:hypothetical protein [Tanacetum cinerariifolium]